MPEVQKETQGCFNNVYQRYDTNGRVNNYLTKTVLKSHITHIQLFKNLLDEFSILIKQQDSQIGISVKHCNKRIIGPRNELKMSRMLLRASRSSGASTPEQCRTQADLVASKTSGSAWLGRKGGQNSKQGLLFRIQVLSQPCRWPLIRQR